MAAGTSMQFATGANRDSGCEDCPCIYSTKGCGLPTPSAVRAVVFVQSVLSVLEIMAVCWLTVYAVTSSSAFLTERERDGKEHGRYLEIGGVISAVANGLRILALYYLYGTVKKMNQPSVIAGRGLCICNTLLTYASLLGVIFCVFFFIVAKRLHAVSTADSLAVVVSFGLYAVAALDLAFTALFAYCAIEHYRLMVIRSNTVDLDAWARRDNAKYAVVNQPESQA